ncbi:hypothetical protein [Hymenobacter wooponensis]|uniref:Uncharacterized protein n=1 Tax=Hymenobacter wooponensis TaxID=1525360 RepID=A0A4Z0MC17_9BACT|nr:hypothetical protein [Hymenobacter wooponensis]TGD76795.1 hypothetical protein EU557_25145 [Hymenobacter wooponensis]
MEYTNWMWKAHLPALFELLAQAARAPLPMQAGESLRYSLHSTDHATGLWVDYPFPPVSALRARFALDADDRDILHVSLFAPPDLCEKARVLSLEESLE